MRTFVSRNPLMGYEHLPFDHAVRRAQDLLGGRGYLSNDEYRARLADGRITPDELKQAFDAVPLPDNEQNVISTGSRTIERSEVLLLHVMYGFEPIDPELLSWNARNTDVTSRFRTDVPPDTQTRITASNSKSDYVTTLWKHSLQTLGCTDPCDPELLDEDGDDVSDSNTPAAAHRTAPDKTIHTDANDDRLTQTVGERVHDLTGTNVVEQVNEQMTKWCAAFLDEGLSDWHMPSRELGFYDAWRQCAQRDISGRFMGIHDFRDRVARLPSRPEDAIMHSMHRLDISDECWSEYLTRHFAHLPGWAGFIRWRSAKPEYTWQARHPINLVHYLAVRLFYEVELVHAVCQRELGCEGTSQALAREEQRKGEQDNHHIDRNMALVCRDAWRLFHVAQFLELSTHDIQSMSPQDARTLMQWLDAFPPDEHGPVWLSAYEHHYRRDLMSRLSTGRTTRSSDAVRPNAQAAFCIDVRSEPFRRHLEVQGNYETIGYAGFFGVPIHYRGLAQEESLPLCPMLLVPQNDATEVPRSGLAERTEQFILGSRWHDLGQHLFHALKSHPITSYMLIDVFGLLFGLAFLGKMIIQKPYRQLAHWFHEWLIPQLATTIPIRRVGSQDPRTHESVADQRATTKDALPTYGFTLEEQAQIVENGLRLTGLTGNHARLVLFCGHGSTTENNPYAAALDCGACGGSHGGPNARVLATMANHPQVRAEIRVRGIEIPDDTWFVAGEHDTTTDRIELLDTQDIPRSHHDDMQRLERDLEQAGQRVAMERITRLPNAPRLSRPDEAARHVWRRSGDWSQVRPEWGLSSNAAIIIGKRSLTAGLPLDGRTFLHNYHDHQDDTGDVLEKIMTAPLVVAQWISSQYYFSAADPWVYGSGSKVIHNVVGGIGVMLGSQSDLQTGFPLQTVNNATTRYHEPMRLLAIIQAPPERISNIIQRHTMLQQHFNNQWVHLFALDSQTGTFQHYQPGGEWRPIPQDVMKAA